MGSLQAIPNSGCFSFTILEKSCNLSFVIDIHVFGSRFLRQAGHGQDVAGKRYDKAGTGGDAQFSYGDGKAFGAANLRGIVGQGILGLGHADGHLVEAEFLDFDELFFVLPR